MKPLHAIGISAMTAAVVFAMSTVHAGDISKLSSTVKTPVKLAPATQTNATYSRFIVTYRNGTTEHGNKNAVLQNINSAISRANLHRVTTSSTGTATAPLTATYQRKLAMGADVIRTSRPLTQSEANTLMQQIAADPAVAHVQPDRKMYAVQDIAAPANLQKQANSMLQAVTPNDEFYAKYQWHFWDPTGGANVNNAWSLADGTGVTIAILDTGITEHPDLDTSLANDGYDFISDAFASGRDNDDRAPGGWDTGDWTNTEPYMSECTDASHPPEPSSWHGTHVSGTAAELTNNNIGMAGVAYNAKILPVRVLGHCGGYESDIADAIEWASGGHVDGVPDNMHPAQVINMSLSGYETCDASTPESVAIANALSRGTVVVVSAGNSTMDVKNFTPASCPGVVTVAATGITGKQAFYTNYGTGVTLAAPGGGIFPNDGDSGTPVDNGFVWSALNDGTTTPGKSVYAGYAGTSQAAPHVTGTVALMQSARLAAGMPALTPEEIKNILTSSARAFLVKEDVVIGAGIVDAAAAIEAALNDDGGTTPPPDSIKLTKGMLLQKQSVGYDGNILYSIDVPAGAKMLNIRSMGGSGDAVLYVKAGSAPTNDGSNADFISNKPGTSEAVVISKPQATTYYILLAAKRVDKSPYYFENVSVLADYNH